MHSRTLATQLPQQTATFKPQQAVQLQLEAFHLEEEACTAMCLLTSFRSSDAVQHTSEICIVLKKAG
jgi:hypothetical protein